MPLCQQARCARSERSRLAALIACRLTESCAWLHRAASSAVSTHAHQPHADRRASQSTALCAQERSDKKVLLDTICDALALLHGDGLLGNVLMHALASDVAAALSDQVRASRMDGRQQACFCSAKPRSSARSWHIGVHPHHAPGPW